MTVRETAGADAIDEAPLDEEPDDDDRDGGLSEARAQAGAGLGISTTELEKRLGIKGWPERWFERVVGRWVGPLERKQPRGTERREDW
jgi:hypothetical protein